MKNNRKNNAAIFITHKNSFEGVSRISTPTFYWMLKRTTVLDINKYPSLKAFKEAWKKSKSNPKNILFENKSHLNEG